MPYTARELINRAYYLSGIVSRRFQSVSGGQATDGLGILNELLAVEGINGMLIPYFKEYNLAAVIGQESYFIPGLIKIETITFNIGTVRYSMTGAGRERYFGRARADNIQSLPYEWHIERKLNGADLYLYFIPSQNYPVTIWGKFKLDEVTDLCDDLSLVYDRYYIRYLTYITAADICDENHQAVPPNVEKQIAIMENKLTTVSPLDMRLRKKSSFSRDSSINYGDVNLGRGWRPCP